MVYAFAGGYADAIGYLLVRAFTGHVTGNLVLLAVSLQHPHWPEIVERAVAIVTFLLATSVGFRIAQQGKRRSPWVLFVAQAVLVVAVSLPFIRASQHHDLWLIAGLCLALGLQNGAITSSGGVSLHATFISGDLTSFVKLVSQGRGENKSSLASKEAVHSVTPKGTLLLGVAFCFVGGAYSASLLIGKLGPLIPLTLLLPFGVAAVLSAVSNTESQAGRSALTKQA